MCEGVCVCVCFIMAYIYSILYVNNNKQGHIHDTSGFRTKN